MRVFRFFSEHGLLHDYADFFDWLFTDKFDQARWSNKNRIQSFTKRIYRLNGLSEHQRIYEPQKNISYPSVSVGLPVPMVYMAKGDSFGRDWVRHIRNGFAHGRCVIIEREGSYIIEIKDFSSTDNQTAYLLLPLGYLLETKRIYEELSKRWEGRRASKRAGY